MRNKKMYVGVEVREIEEGAEDEKGKKQKQKTRQEQLQEKGT